MHAASKGQSSMEQMIVVAIGLTLIAAVFYISSNMATDSLRVSQARDMVQKLSKSADYVHSLGPGASEEVSVYVPDGVVFTQISNNTVHVRISLSSGESDVFADCSPDLIGELPLTPGQQDVLVAHTESGKVMFGKSSLSCAPLALTKSLVQGESGTGIIELENIGEYLIEDLSADSDGSISDLMQFSQPAGSLETGTKTQISLTFSVPLDTEPGSYSSAIIASGNLEANATGPAAYCSSMVTVLVAGLQPPDTQGPQVIFLGHKPRNPSMFSTLTIEATADDSETGGNGVEACEVELDGLGIWAEMDPLDGAYGEVLERVTHTMGPLSAGDHYVSVRCVDSELNLGPERRENFTVYPYLKEVLFLTTGSTPSSEEQLWISWLDAHSSDEGFAWNYDVNSSANLASGAINASLYQIIAIVDYNDAATDKLIEYKNTGHYVLLLGTSVKEGPRHLISALLGAGKLYGGDHIANGYSYITDGFTIGETYTIVDACGVWGSMQLQGIPILAPVEQPEYATLGDAATVLTYGVACPDQMTIDGNTFATRVFDYALLES